MNLTKSIIDRATYTGSNRLGSDGKAKWERCVLWDESVPGLGLRVTPTGRKSFVLSYRIGTRKRQITLGLYGALTLQQARVTAFKQLAAVLEGKDPLALREQAARGRTVAEVSQRYLAEHAIPKKKASSVSNDRQMLRKHVLPKLGGLKVADVARSDIAKLHHSLRESPYAANRVVALLSKIFSFCEKWGLRTDGTNSCRHVEKFKEQKRERFLSSDELSCLARVLKESEESGLESPHAIAAIRLLILTGCRRREILHLRWEHVDLDNRRLNLSDSKTGAKTVYLADPAREILESLPRSSGNPWVIEGRNQDSHLYDLKGPWHRIRERAQLDGLRLHDLRHNAESWIMLSTRLSNHPIVAKKEKTSRLTLDSLRIIRGSQEKSRGRHLVDSVLWRRPAVRSLPRRFP